MKLLLPVDGSACSERAVAHLIRHVSWLKEAPEIHVLHVHLPIPLGRGQGTAGHEQVAAYYREESFAEMASAEQLLSAAGMTYERHVHVGQPPEVIAKFAREQACDLIFMGTHGRSALGEVVMGSVASQVLHLVDKPVVLVK